MALGVDQATGLVDLRYDGGLCESEGFETDFIISLGTDRRAPEHASLEPEDRRGWWADPELGSRVWLEMRGGVTEETLARVRLSAEESLAWTLKEGVARSVTATTKRMTRDAVELVVTLVASDGTTWAVTWMLTAEGAGDCAISVSNA